MVLAIFARAYLGALLIHYSKRWAEPEITLVFLALFLLSLVKIEELATFFAASAAVITFELSGFPRLANHTNLTLFISVFVWLLLGAAFVQRKLFAENALINGLRGMAIVLYFYVGFHKINTGFLNLSSSCTTWYHDKLERTAFNGTSVIPELIRVVSPQTLIVLDLIVCALLIFPRTWVWGLLLAVPIHMYVSLSGFTDFSSLMHAIMLLFLPPWFWVALQENPASRRLFLRSVAVYFVGIIAFATFSGLAQWHWFLSDNLRSTILGIWLDVLIVEMTIVVIVIAYSARSSVTTSKKYSWLPWKISHLIFPYMVFIWGAFPYLFGAQTSLTMFSNLVTEATRQNHLLIDTRKTKLIDFEADLVEIRDIHSTTRPPSRYDLQGYLLPMSEFRYIATISTDDPSRQIELTIRHKDQEVYISNLGLSEYANRPLSSYLFTFRQIDPFGYAKCRW